MTRILLCVCLLYQLVARMRGEPPSFVFEKHQREAAAIKTLIRQRPAHVERSVHHAPCALAAPRCVRSTEQRHQHVVDGDHVSEEGAGNAMPGRSLLAG